MTKDEMKAMIARVRDRKRYSGFTQETLAGIADADLVLAIVTYLHDHVLVGDGANAASAYDELGAGMRAVFATDVLDAQVRNGGFSQFFWNASGRFAPDALDGFERIGARQRAVIVQQAIDLFLREGGLNLRKVGRESALTGYSDFAGRINFRALDSAYYKLDATEDVERLRVAYIRTHPEEFVTL
jgi:hypothetical protein